MVTSRAVDGRSAGGHSQPSGARRGGRCGDHGRACTRNADRQGVRWGAIRGSIWPRRRSAWRCVRGRASPIFASVEAFRQTLLAAPTIAYSDSASGVYLSTVLFRQLGVAEQMQGRRRSVPGEPAGTVVARGEAELAFQQISELLPVPGIEIVGPLPDAIQQITVFFCRIPVNSQALEAAQTFLRYLLSSLAAEATDGRGGLRVP